MEKSGCTFFMGMDMLLERKVERIFALDYPALHRWVGTGICRNAHSRIRCFWYFGQCLSFGNGVSGGKGLWHYSVFDYGCFAGHCFCIDDRSGEKSGFYNKVVLRDKQEAQDFDESTLQGLLGAEGVTQTTLRPYGVADFQGKWWTYVPMGISSTAESACV